MDNTHVLHRCERCLIYLEPIDPLTDKRPIHLTVCNFCLRFINSPSYGKFEEHMLFGRMDWWKDYRSARPLISAEKVYGVS